MTASRPSPAGAGSALDLEATYDAIHSRVVAIAMDFDLVSVSGADALSYLQGQVSQDIGSLTVGGVTETLLLSPQGKLDAYCRLVRSGENEAVLVVEDGFGDLVYERLRRFKLRVKAELGRSRWKAARLCGPGASTAVVADGLDIGFSYPGLAGRDVGRSEIIWSAQAPSGDAEAYEAARIEAGLPAMGREITEKTIPQETGIVERTVSFTKGCYTGQELVARIDARGNRVPRRLVGFVGKEIRAGASVVISEREVGTVTSAAFSPRVDGGVALGYLKRDVEVPTRVELVSDREVAVADALALPLRHS